MKKLQSVSGAMLVFIRFCVDVCQKSDNRYCQHLSSPTTHDYRMSHVLHSIFQLFGIELCFLRITHTQYVRCSCFSDKFEIFCHLLQELRKQEVFSFHLQFMISIETAVHTSTILFSNSSRWVVRSFVLLASSRLASLFKNILLTLKGLFSTGILL